VEKYVARARTEKKSTKGQSEKKPFETKKGEGFGEKEVVVTIKLNVT